METVKRGDRAKESEVAEEGSLGAGVVSIVYLLEILFIFTRKNSSVCYFCSNGAIWASGTMAEAAAVAAPELGAGVALGKTAASGVASFLRETGRLVASLRTSKFI